MNEQKYSQDGRGDEMDKTTHSQMGFGLSEHQENIDNLENKKNEKDDYSPKDRGKQIATAFQKLKIYDKEYQYGLSDLMDDEQQNKRMLSSIEKPDLQQLYGNKQRFYGHPPHYGQHAHSSSHQDLSDQAPVDSPPSYEDAVIANKMVDLNMTTHEDVTSMLERTKRMEKINNKTMKRVDALGVHMKEESKERRQETEKISETLLQQDSRQEERHRYVTRSIERISVRLDTMQRTPELRDEVESNMFQNQLEMSANEDDDSGLYKCKRCRCRCPCSCHRRHSKRRETNNRETGNERHRQKEYSGDIPDAHSSNMKHNSANDQLVGACGGDHGGSSDNSSDSNDDNKEREQKWLGRQERDKEKKQWKKGNISDSKSKSDQLVGACGGNPGGSSYDSSDSSDDSKKRRRKWQDRLGRNKRKPNWIIDSAAWKTCIGSKNADMIDGLLSEKKLPDKDLLNEACKVFELKFRRLICDEICKYIVNKSSHIIYVYPATIIEEATNESNACTITFVVVVGESVDLGNDFKFLVKNTKDPAPQENVKMKICEKEKQQRVSENETDSNIAGLTKCIQNHSTSLRKKHTNVCRISHSGFKSRRFDKEDCSMEQIDCITLYVYAKSFIPLGETLLPETLDVDGCQVLVDVREGFVEAYTGNQGPCDTLDHLRMGCSIGVEPPKNKEAVNGTLGGFFKFGGKDFCMSAAHVFLSANEMQGMQDSPLFERNDSAKQVYQPHNNRILPFGSGRTAVYKEGGKGATGVDVISILIDNRNPNTGEFPKCDRGQESDREYSRGKVYTREEIRNALKSDANRCFFKYGCRTGWTTGRFRAECATFCAPHPVQNGNKDFKICLHNQFEIYSDTDNDFAEKSDSGALVFMDDREELVAVGMVVAGMAGEVCFVTPLDEILKALKLQPENGLKDFTTGGTMNVSNESDEVSKDAEISAIKSDLSNVKTDVNAIKCSMRDMENNMNRGMNAITADVQDSVNKLGDRMEERIISLFQNIQFNNQQNSDKNS